MTLDINPLESGSTGTLEKASGFATQEEDGVAAILQQMLAVMVNDELGCIRIGFEAELFRDES